ncbi:portal protein [Bacillus phage Bastille]|uniref:Uncharacterized protein n=6 Tax=Bastillevirus TaxID=1918010 RepID=A0A024B0V6_9CAUD|nr:portal protein [Bacillus phage Bastille]YP_009035269.1 portal protein [Bacillus phage Hoody T]YP_009035598.1 portal protein [Bacillus phage Evoli]YP_009036976.1 portal protein [Bacillus phage CAM003]AMW61830.1 hypothetical protein DNAM5_86 [Bacillus phage Vinny]ASR79594.1 hypothetical protein OTK52_82 [Bacillus phage OTooleKemple52]ASR79754.1 hypothetical protein JANET_83 [Bacillus phage Janet]ASU00925.1 hypothetical protein ANTHONY_85 [Bacillus phage Anthony]AXQ67291.1 hypothetical prot
MSFHQVEDVWIKAKSLLSQGYTWIEVVTYYKMLGGMKVKVYVYLDRVKYRIVGVAEEPDKVLLENKHGEIIRANYTDVKNGRKKFDCD